MSTDQSTQSTAIQGEASVFVIERTLDYVVRQSFAVRASSPAVALKQLRDYCTSNWTAQAAQAAGVAQLSDAMEQADNSEEFYVSDRPVIPAELAVDGSMIHLIEGEAASKMRLLIQRLPAEVLNLSPGEPLSDQAHKALLSLAVAAASLEAAIKSDIQDRATSLQSIQTGSVAAPALVQVDRPRAS